MGDAGCVVADVRHDPDLRITGGPLSCGDEPFGHLAVLGGGDRRKVRAAAVRVQGRGPGGAATLQGDDDRVGPALAALA